jgi:hypothetical protein
MELTEDIIVVTMPSIPGYRIRKKKDDFFLYNTILAGQHSENFSITDKSSETISILDRKYILNYFRSMSILLSYLSVKRLSFRISYR